jgi:hypothetical protein
LITAFEVGPAADEPFVAGWDRARAGVAEAVLHRALRRGVAHRFVELVRARSPEHGRAAIDALDAAVAFAPHPGLYDVVSEEGDPGGTDGGVLLIEPFEVPPDADDEFESAWAAARAVLSAQRGHLGARLYRSGGPADFRYVGLTRWSSPLMVARASADPAVQDAAAAMPFASHPAIHQVVRP